MRTLILDVGGYATQGGDGQEHAGNFCCSGAPPFFVVAAGRGEKAAQKLAGYLAVQRVAVLLQLARDRGHWFWHSSWGSPPVKQYANPLEAILQHAVSRAHDQLRRMSGQTRGISAMHTALTAGMIQGRELVFIHLGDTRLYRLRGGRLRCVTKDHTAAMKLLREGSISVDAYHAHPGRHVLTKYLGGASPHDAMFGAVDLAPGDAFLFCSPGVYNALSEHTMQNVLAGKPQDATRKAKALVLPAKNGSCSGSAAAVVVGVT
ncbi:PP2C family protein-serine/threonine phosphatase [Acanthopleuribacter pedis]|uniref:Protein phosphatase 2C domain-containing protein n=1 Tax=Acanthopleuribacter pedis TaxID=442870 RepID=A0A8J7QLB2_9BACT|nr:protein phosphatase 2C domain-containing protein [Acanthopleuribacter pedis]MBO1320348.1 protein phosphatase 2C domain-containing protein [Acanthopleuribacter pedis]